VKIRAILVASLVAPGSSSAPAEPLLRSGFLMTALRIADTLTLVILVGACMLAALLF
jgi:hypothetical protein